MDFILLSLMTQKPNILPQIAADETKDNSWLLGTGIATINQLQESQDTHRQDGGLHCHKATRANIIVNRRVITSTIK